MMIEAMDKYTNKIIFKLTYKDHVSELILDFREGINAIVYLQYNGTEKFLRAYKQQQGAYSISNGDVTYNGIPYFLSDKVSEALEEAEYELQMALENIGGDWEG